MNILVVPFHDWRKCSIEGFRTRDSHFLQHLSASSDVDRVVVVNRPTTVAELVIKRAPRRLEGTPLIRLGGSELLQVSEKTFVFDFVSSRVPQQVLMRKKWFFSAYGSTLFWKELSQTLERIQFRPDAVLSQNVFAYGLVERFPDKKIAFDAWDNFLKFPSASHLGRMLEKAYASYAQSAKLWLTNSEENMSYFRRRYGVPEINVIRNGVDVERFTRNYSEPEELRRIPRPIVGIGAKVSHLVDVELLNNLIEDHKDINFVLVGQILDRGRFHAIHRAPNFHYLGDKHYDQYPAYVKHFDVCVLPYVSSSEGHGQDSIKVYEYLAAGRKVLALKGCGVDHLSDYLTLADNIGDFSLKLRKLLASEEPTKSLPETFTWGYKAAQLLDLIRTVAL